MRMIYSHFKFKSQFCDFRYKKGTTLAAETDSSSVITVHVYYNALFPSTIGPWTDVIKIMSVDTDQQRALSDFNAGARMLRYSGTISDSIYLVSQLWP